MEERRIKKWLRVIAFVKLISSMIGLYFHFLIQPGIEESLNWFDLFYFYFNSLAELIIFAGLWRFKPWGWKAAVLLIPISYLFVVYDYITDYVAWVGILLAPFILLDVFILRYLFKRQVMIFCKVSSIVLSHLRYSPEVLLNLAMYFVVSEFGSELVGIGVVLAILMGFGVAKRYRKKKPEDLTTASTGSAINPASR